MYLGAQDTFKEKGIWFDHVVESRFGPKRGFGLTPGQLLKKGQPNPYPKSEKPPARKGFTNPNL